MNNDTYQRIYTKDEYLAELSRYLHKLPQDDYESAMAYFREYFEEAGPENEAQAMRDLGTPKEAASEILQNLLHDDNGARKNDTARTLKIAAIAMLLSPIGWLGLLFGGIFLVVAAAMIFAIIVSAVAVDAALFYSGGCLILASFGMISESLSAAAVISGGGILAIGAGLLIITIGLALCRAIAYGAVTLFHRLSQKGRA